MRRVESKIVINAEINKVWSAITSIQNYPNWNPFIIAVDASQIPPIVDTEMEFTVYWKNGSIRKTKEVVNSFLPPKESNAKKVGEWSYYFKSFLSTIAMIRATRKQIISSTEEGVTFYHTYEDFKGWGVYFLPIANIKDGFDRQAKALKKYCEQRD